MGGGRKISLKNLSLKSYGIARKLKKFKNETKSDMFSQFYTVSSTGVYSSRLRAQGGGILGSWGRILGPAAETCKNAREACKKLDYSLNLTRFSLDNTVIALFKVFLR